MFEVIDAIRIRPTHSNMMEPGFGVGGYCLTKDPLMAQLAAQELFDLNDVSFPFCNRAIKVNHSMPLHSIRRLEDCLGSLSGRRLLVLGVTYREDVGDTRFSPSEIFVKEAEKRGATIVCHDPLVDKWIETGRDVVRVIPKSDSFDAVLLAVRHQEYRNMDFAGWVGSNTLCILDANGVLTAEQISSLEELPNVLFAKNGRG